MVSSDSEPQDAGNPSVAPGVPEPTGSPGRRIPRRLLVVAASLSLIAATAGVADTVVARADQIVAAVRAEISR